MWNQCSQLCEKFKTLLYFIGLDSLSRKSCLYLYNEGVLLNMNRDISLQGRQPPTLELFPFRAVQLGHLRMHVNSLPPRTVTIMTMLKKGHRSEVAVGWS